MRGSAKARRSVASSLASLHCLLLHAVALLVLTIASFAQEVSPQVPAPSPVVQSEGKQNAAELASRDEPTTFKVNVKLVVVRAVVRDSQGYAVGNLRQEDFQIRDKGKLQLISQFEVEQPGALVKKARRESEDKADTLSGSLASSTATMPVAPERFVAYLFDDVHLEFGDLGQTRAAAVRHFSTLRPTDRAAIFTTSGRTMLDFTDDQAKLRSTLLQLAPQPIASGFQNDCPAISYYQADLIVNKNDLQALSVAQQEALSCQLPPSSVSGLSMQVLSAGDQESRVSLGVLKDVVRNLSHMPGQRSVVFISPGFITPQMEYEYADIIDRAVRSQVFINAMDARGLYVPNAFGDISHSTGHPPPPAKALIESAAAQANDDLPAALAEGTGGIFFHNSNDLDEGFRRTAQAPEYSYVLAFAPQNLKLDGGFHALKVTLKNPQKLTLQTRRGYYAPKHPADPNEEVKQEIEDATFSQEELHNLPVKLRTQFFKASDTDAKLIVLAHVDVQHLRFRKVSGRNNNVLTCVSALFNRNGNFVQGMQKTLTLNLKDETLEHKLASGITLKTSFDVKPGSYLVRLVVRDAEGQSMSAENGTVEIR
jgi:VWFA-related protein